mmetsp:Transcript_26891/g.74113  ORF Transcript_26891/g.74113 Transcript_26891/m.74113 type:complete len:306 (-) Transcript_26891:193-1110(-)
MIDTLPSHSSNCIESVSGRHSFDCAMEPLINSSLHSLIEKNNELRAELQKCGHVKTDNAKRSADELDNAIPKDSFGLHRYQKYIHHHHHHHNPVEDEDDDDDCCSSCSDDEDDTTSNTSWAEDSASSVSSSWEPRRVRFSLSEEPDNLDCCYNPSRKTHCRRYNSEMEEPLSEDDCAALWYNSQDFHYFRKYSKKLASLAAASQYGPQLDAVLEVCHNANGNQDVTHCSRIANSAARGLELVIATASDDIQEHRRRVILSTVQQQAACSPDELAQRSKALTRSSRLFARILGNGDAAVARAMNRS